MKCNLQNINMFKLLLLTTFFELYCAYLKQDVSIYSSTLILTKFKIATKIYRYIP